MTKNQQLQRLQSSKINSKSRKNIMDKNQYTKQEIALEKARVR